MAPSVNGSNEFSPCSKTQMADDIAAAMGVCISPLPSVDMTIAPPTLSNILLGNAANVTFDVVNNGTIGATNVNTAVTLPNNVSLIASSASQGSCTTNASTVSCALGDISGSSGGTVTITADTVAVGAAQFVATVTSDVDDNPANNQQVLNLSIDPAVELTAAAGDGTVTVGQSANVSIALENTATLAATAVTASVTLDAGLQAESANWGLGNCHGSGTADRLRREHFRQSVELDADGSGNRRDGRFRELRRHGRFGRGRQEHRQQHRLGHRDRA